MKKKLGYRFIKRSFDICASFLALIILSPLMIIIGILVSCTSKGGPFYLDKRYGKDKKIINVIKFRSMKKDNRSLEEVLGKELYIEYCKNFKLNGDPRVTKLGKILRKTSLDELPQLFNIFIGNMSIVGPRPIATKEFEYLWKDKDIIFSMRPGLTGMWAVNGRSALKSYDTRVNLEVSYIKKASILLDIKIIFMTIDAVLKHKTS